MYFSSKIQQKAPLDPSTCRTVCPCSKTQQPSSFLSQQPQIFMWETQLSFSPALISLLWLTPQKFVGLPEAQIQHRKISLQRLRLSKSHKWLKKRIFWGKDQTVLRSHPNHIVLISRGILQPYICQDKSCKSQGVNYITADFFSCNKSTFVPEWFQHFFPGCAVPSLLMHPHGRECFFC